MYSLYHFHKRRNTLRAQDGDILDEDGEKLSLSEFNERMSWSLPFLFNAEPGQLDNAEFNLEAGQEWLECGRSVGDAFLMPAERNGLHLFFRELSSSRTALLHHASRPNIDILELLRDVMRSPYALPIADYIDWLNNMTENQRSKSAGFHPYADRVKSGLVHGAYRVDRVTGSVRIQALPGQARRTEDGGYGAAHDLQHRQEPLRPVGSIWSIKRSPATF